MSHLYVEYGRLAVDRGELVFVTKDNLSVLPVESLSVCMIGPGSSITHDAVKVAASHGCLLLWVGEVGVRHYASLVNGERSTELLERQVRLWADDTSREEVARRMFAYRFGVPVGKDVTVEQLRGMEGSRVRDVYHAEASKRSLVWEGRRNKGDWSTASRPNRSLSAATACWHGVSAAAVDALGLSPGLGFIHTGKQLSFVLDVADLFKTSEAVPIAFDVAADPSVSNVELEVRHRVRDHLASSNGVQRVIDAICEVVLETTPHEPGPGQNSWWSPGEVV